MNIAPRVSVVMASYNHSAFVREAVNSVLTQSYQNIELVVTDDGSQDCTADVIKEIDDPRIHLRVFEKNQGACVAINDAIARARGEYIAVLNSDDYFLPGKLAKQVVFLDAHPEIGAVFGLPQFIDEKGRTFENPRHVFTKVFKTENGSRHELLRFFFYHGNCLCHPTVMVRKECYERVGLFDPLLLQLPDLDMWVRLCGKFDIFILPEKLTAFRILDRERNVSARSREKHARSAWELLAVLQHYAEFTDAELCAIFQLPGGQIPCRSPKVEVALAALRQGGPGFVQFGSALLRDCLRRDRQAFSMNDYFKLIGQVDPCSAEFYGKEYRIIKDAKLLALARRVYYWLSARNS